MSERTSWASAQEVKIIPLKTKKAPTKRCRSLTFWCYFDDAAGGIVAAVCRRMRNRCPLRALLHAPADRAPPSKKQGKTAQTAQLSHNWWGPRKAEDFLGRGGATARVSRWLFQIKVVANDTQSATTMAGAQRLELWTRGFGDRCSTNWAIPLNV